MSGEDLEWQRLDKWLWCARFMRARSDCARLVAGGSVRINRQVTDKAHAKLRVGDVLTLPLAQRVRVIEVIRLGLRRGPAAEAQTLYREIIAPAPETQFAAAPTERGCKPGQTAAYAEGGEA